MPTQQRIIINGEDYRRLEHVFFGEFAAAFSDKSYLQALRGELDCAEVVATDEIPPDVVTMNSTVRLRDVDSDQVESFTLVYPEEANIAEAKLSVLAPIGTAILGCRVGDVVSWQVPGGAIQLRIEELVFQPERSGVAA